MPKEISADRARQAKPLGVVRWVLGLSFAGAALALAIILVYFVNS